VAYDWPTTPGGEAPLIEEYTYYNVKLNVGLTDLDFDKTNPAYNFPKLLFRKSVYRTQIRLIRNAN